MENCTCNEDNSVSYNNNGTTAASLSLPVVPASLLVSFLEQATKDLNLLNITTVVTLDDCTESTQQQQQKQQKLSQFQSLILQTQQSTLSCIVSSENDNDNDTAGTNTIMTIELVQEQLLNIETHPEFSTRLQGPLELMTMAARQALARLVLQQELRMRQQEEPSVDEPSSSSSVPVVSLTRTAVFEFCGLCQAAIQLEQVKDFLTRRNRTGNVRDNSSNNNISKAHDSSLRLYDTVIPGGNKLLFPQERMHYIQKLYFKALGYPNADSANQQLQGIIQGDDELEQVFMTTMNQLREALAVATMQMQQEELNDFEQGGVTRVISVSYSDHAADPDNTSGTMPRTMDMVRSSLDDHQTHYTTSPNENNNDSTTTTTTTTAVSIAHQETAALEQTLLAQLLQMDSDERNATLEQAQMAHDEVMVALEQLPTASERVAYMTTRVSTETRQLLLVGRIWQGLLDRNGGTPPTMASTRDRDY